MEQLKIRFRMIPSFKALTVSLKEAEPQILLYLKMMLRSFYLKGSGSKNMVVSLTELKEPLLVDLDFRIVPPSNLHCSYQLYSQLFGSHRLSAILLEGAIQC